MDRLRQGLFSSLGPRVEGAWFIDLFAGTGSYGLEAASRGAAGGIFVERDRGAVGALRANIEAVCRSAGRTTTNLAVSCSDALLWMPPEGLAANLIFLDPPFSRIPEWAESLFRRCRGFMNPDGDGLLIFQMPGELELASPGWRLLKRIGRGRGQPTCCLYALE
jgi:16S rRNA (guanine966-N2)-methyltransferase